MAVSISSDLFVRVHEDVNVTKITERQQALRESLQKGEPKALGVSGRRDEREREREREKERER